MKNKKETPPKNFAKLAKNLKKAQKWIEKEFPLEDNPKRKRELSAINDAVYMIEELSNMISLQEKMGVNALTIAWGDEEEVENGTNEKNNNPEIV